MVNLVTLEVKEPSGLMATQQRSEFWENQLDGLDGT